MEEIKAERIKSLNPSETQVLHELFKDPGFRVPALAQQLFKSEGSIRTNLTAIFDKLGVPDGIENKRDWVLREYAEEYEYVFKREEWETNHPLKRESEPPEIFIKPPDPVVVVPEPVNPPPQPVIDIVPVSQVRQYSESYVRQLKKEISDLKNNMAYYQTEWQRLKDRAPDWVVVLFLLTTLAAGAIAYGMYKYNQELMKITIDTNGTQGKILYYDHFDDIYVTRFLISDNGNVNNSYLITDNKFQFPKGDDSWVNYRIKYGLFSRGCNTPDPSRVFEIGVRYNISKDIYQIAKSYVACGNITNAYFVDVIAVQGNQISSSREDGSDYLSLTIADTGFNKGGIFIKLDKSFALDFIEVVELP